MPLLVLAIASSALVRSAWADDRLLTYWVQLGPGGVQQARAVMSGGTCPRIVAFRDETGDERTDIAMQVRAPATADFPAVCEAEVPKDTGHAWFAMSKEEGDGRQRVMRHEAGKRARAVYDTEDAVPLMRPDPERIVVLGDTGCRLKGSFVQACNDPVAWPFAAIAKAAPKWWPDLVVHVGDYYYRETACPEGNAGCAGSPFGDNWAAWDADFFAPGHPLLAAAPIVLVRGNHEDCARGGPGFLRLMGSGAYDPNAPCTAHVAPYSIPLDGLNLVVMDNADAQDTSIDPPTVPVYEKELAGLAAVPDPSWLLMHRPLWGAVKGPLGIPVGGNATMIAALDKKPVAAPIALTIAGHIHSFEAINYKSKAPPLLLAGHGGDALDDTPADLAGAVLSGVRVKDGISEAGFGFLLMTRQAKDWKIDLFDAAGAFDRECLFHDRRIDCPDKKA